MNGERSRIIIRTIRRNVRYMVAIPTLLVVATWLFITPVTAADFKVEAHPDPASGTATQIKVSVQNPPPGTTDIILFRDNGAFILTQCEGGAPGAVLEGGIKVEAGKTYCDRSVTSNKTYTYKAKAKIGTATQETGPTFVPFNVTGNTTTQSYRYLFGTDNLNDFVNKLVNWLAYVVGPLIVGIMILYAGMQYITSRGNEAHVKEAKERIFGAVLGYILLMLTGAMMRAIF